MAGCSGGADFPVSALAKVSPAQDTVFEDEAGPALRAFLFTPKTGQSSLYPAEGKWLVLDRDQSSLRFAHRLGPKIGIVNAERKDGKWSIRGWSSPCYPRLATTTRWDFAAPADPAATTITVNYETGTSCYPPGGMVPAEKVDVVESEASVAIAVYLKRDVPPPGFDPPKNYSCGGVGMKGTEVVKLRAPLGARTVLDGGAIPPAAPDELTN
jgi:hypothetical protein